MSLRLKWFVLSWCTSPRRGCTPCKLRISGALCHDCHCDIACRRTPSKLLGKAECSRLRTSD
uniref:Uncharacterized protein n=1 Tax=Oryza glumipatula TaxID=40148 RepID=A0A0E0ATW0_9ORYZ